MCQPAEARVVTKRSLWTRLLDAVLGPPLPILHCGRCGGVMRDSPRKPKCCRSYLQCHGPYNIPGVTGCLTLEVVWS